MYACTIKNKTVTLESGSVASIRNTTGISKLTINKGCQVTIQGNDFSGTTIVLNNIPEGEVIDLSGNYWGTTNLDEIIGKIQGYDETRVLISTILPEPNAQVFSFDSSMMGVHRVSDAAEYIVLTFNADVDSSTVSSDTIRLVDEKGQVLVASGYDVAGNTVTVHLNGIPKGTYTVQVSSGVRDVRGNAFTEPEGQRKVNFLSMELTAPKVIFFRSNSTVTDQFRYVDIFFDQDMDASTITTDNVHIYTESGKKITINRILQSGIQGNVFFRAYFDEVTEHGTYSIIVDAEVEGADGRCMDADYVKEVYVSSPDLLQSGLVEYTDNRLGRYTTITYSVQNAGDGVAQGTWTDHIYLCKSETWDESRAVFFASVQRNNQSIEPGETYTASARAMLSGVQFGEYYVFVKTDMSSRLSESDDANNISATGTTIVLGADTHMHGDSAYVMSSANEVLYVTYTAEETGSVCFGVDGVKTRIFVSEEFPTSGNSIASVVSAGDATHAYFAVEAGKTYNICLYPQMRGEVRTNIQTVEFDVVSASIAFVAPGRTSTFKLIGACFSQGMQVWLEDADGNRIEAGHVVVHDACSASVSITMPEHLVSGSTLHLVVKDNLSGVEVRRDELFSVISSAGEEVEVKFATNNGSSIRVNFVSPIEFDIVNKQAYDVEGCIVFLETSMAQTTLHYGSQDDGRSMLLYLSGSKMDDQLVLEASQTERHQAYVRATTSGSGPVYSTVVSTYDDTQITNEMWGKIEAALKPADMDDAAWSAWWGDMQPRIGSTMGDFARFINDMRTLCVTDGVTCTNAAELMAYVMVSMPEYKPTLKIAGVVTGAEGEEMASRVMISVYCFVNGERELFKTVETDENGRFEVFGALPNQSYELEFSGTVIYEGRQVNTVKVETSISDSEIAFTLAPDGAELYDETAIRLASDGAGNQLRVVLRDSNLYACNVNATTEEVQLLAADRSLTDFELIWSEHHQLYLLLFAYHEDDELKNAMILLRPEGSTYAVSQPVEINPGNIEDLYVTEEGEVIYVSTSAGTVAENSVDLVFAPIDISGVTESVDDTATIQDVQSTEGLSRKDYLENRTYSVSFELGVPSLKTSEIQISSQKGIALERTIKIWEEEKYIKGESSISGEIRVGWDDSFSPSRLDLKKLEFSVENEIRKFIKITWSESAKSWYDCQSKMPVSAWTSSSASITVGVRDDYGAFALLGPVAGGLLERMTKFLAKWKVKIVAGYAIKVEGSLTKDKNEGWSGTLGFKDSGVYAGLGLDVSAGGDALNVAFSAEMKGYFSIDGGVEWKHGKVDTYGELDGGMEVSIRGNVKIMKLKASVEATVGASYKDGYRTEYDWSFGWDKAVSTSGTTYLYEKQLQDVAVFSYDDVKAGDYAGHEALSAYAYMTTEGAVSVHYVNAQTLESSGSVIDIAVLDDSSLFSGFSNIQHLDAETNGAGDVYLVASGFSATVDESTHYVQGVVKTEKSDHYAMFGASRLETMTVHSDGEYVLLNQENLRDYNWNGFMVDTTRNTDSVDSYYLDGRLGMVWVASTESGVNQIYTSLLQDDVWQSPTLLYSSLNDLSGCYMSEVDGEFYITFSETVQNSANNGISTYVFTWKNDSWTFDTTLNTEQGQNTYTIFELSNVSPELRVASPMLERLDDGRVQLTLSWDASLACTYVVLIDGVEYEVGTETSYSTIVSGGEHIVSVRATTAAGVSASSDEMTIEMDCSAPVLVNVQRSIIHADADAKIVRWTWGGVDAESVELVVDGVSHVIDSETTFAELALSAGAHEYELILTDASGNETIHREQFEVADASSGLQLLQPECEKLSEGGTRVTFRWCGDVAAEYSIVVDDCVYYVGTAEEYTITLADGKHEYSVRGETSYGALMSADGWMETKTSMPDMAFDVISTDATEDGRVRTRVVWNPAGLVDVVLSDGTTQYAVTESNIYDFVTDDGYVELTLSGTDAFGNTKTESVTFRYDASAPELSLDEVICGVSENGVQKAYFSWECSDISSCEYELYVNDELVYVGDIPAYTMELSETVTHWRVVARDAYGYSSVASAECNIEPAPELLVTVNTVGNGDDTNQTYNLSWNAIDGAKYDVYIDGKHYYVEEGTNLQLSLPQGSFEYTVTALMANGMTSENRGVLGSGELVTSGSLIAETEGWWTNEDIVISEIKTTKIAEGGTRVYISWTREDDAPNYDRYAISVGNTVFTVQGRQWFCEDFLDGTRTLSIAGLQGDSTGPITSTTLTLDATSPIIESFTWKYNTWMINEIELDWTVSEKSTAYVTINGKTEEVGTGSHYEFKFTYGKTYNVTLYTKDAFGNKSNLVSDTITVGKQSKAVDMGWMSSFMQSLGVESIYEKTAQYVKVPDDCKPQCKDGEVLQDGLCVKIIYPVDPNDIYGPVGYGNANWIAAKEMQFQVVCENIPEENIAHAAMVTITQQIDASYDYSTFRLGDMMIAGNYISIGGNVQSYKGRVDWTRTLGVWVDVNAWFDADTGIVTWEFAAIDPETGYVVTDPFTGLLAPNFNPPEGDGGVYYYVAPKSTATTGTEIKAEASIVFDYNEPIATPTLTYTLDVDAPEAVVKSMAAESSSRYLYVAWEGSDVGSGVDYYNIFVSIDGGEWQLWQNGIAATSALYTVAEGEHTYAFFAQGVDHVGNAESLSDLMGAEAATVSTYAPSAGTLTVSAIAANRTGDELVLRVVFSEAASCADWAAALRLTTASGAIDLSNGSFSYDAATHTLTWTGSVAGVADGEKATLRLADGLVKDAQGVVLGDTTPSYSAPVVQDDVAGAAYAAPTLVDYNGDGLLDMLVGENANGKGQVRIFLNEGTVEVASYASFTYAQTAADTPLTLDAEGCQGAIVRLADVTGDDVAEMLIGLADGTVRVFTAAEGGYWVDAGQLTCMEGGKSATIDVGTRAAIDFVDANGDGRTDMLVGTGDGNIVLYLDTASTGAAVFDAGQYLHDAAGRITLGKRASVTATDVDGDGLWDLLVGDADGSIRYYRNEGSATEPLFGEAVSILAGDVALDLSESTDRVRIDAADINGDGLLDIAVGQSDGSVKVLYGTDGANLLGEVVVGNIPLPDAPQNVQISVVASKVTLSWDAVVEEGGAITYEVSYCLQGSSSPTVVSVSDISATWELPDGIYSVQVRALNYGMGGTWSAAQTVTVDTVAPETPAAATAVGGETSATISWSSVADAASYELRYRSAGSSTWRIVTATETSQTLTDMAADGYEWQVRAVDAAGNASEWTSVSEFTVTGELPDYEKHWATGLVFDAQGSVTGGYYDVNKQGVNDSQLCWAAAATNVLTWWQELGDTALSVSGVPTDAASIYATFCGAWENASGVDAYGFIWWLAGESTGSNYADYYDSHYTGDSSTGAYYEQYYTPQNVAQYAAQVSLKNTAADTLSTSWDSIYADGGMITLGIFRSVGSNGTLSGGHSLTLWGYETEVESGMLTSIYVTDSDDGATALITLGVEYDSASGLYRVAAGVERIGGYYLGTYNYLKGFTNEDVVAPEVAVSSLTQKREEDGTTSVNITWLGDAVRYELVVDGELRYSGKGTAFALANLGDGEHSYTIRAIDAAGNTGEYSGTLYTDAKQDDAVYQASDIALGTLPGGGCGTEEAIRNWVGDVDEQDYFRISSAGAGSYSIGIDSADVDAALWLSVGTMNAAGNFVVKQELLITPDSAVHGLGGVNLGAGEARYIRVSVADSTQGTDYAITVKGQVTDSSQLTDNNSLSKATQLSETSEDAVLSSWVGAGDVLDYYRLEMAEGGSLSISLSELEQHAKVRLYQQHADGTVTQAFSTTAQAQSGLDRTLSLTSGVYYLEIAAYDNGAGLYNSTYALELEKEENGTTKRFTIANA